MGVTASFLFWGCSNAITMAPVEGGAVRALLMNWRVHYRIDLQSNERSTIA